MIEEFDDIIMPLELPPLARDRITVPVSITYR